MPPHVRYLMVLMLLFAVLPLSGCIEEPGPLGEGASIEGVTVVVKFGAFEPDLHPGELAEWRPDDAGGWSVDLQDGGDDGTVYRIHNVTGTSVLDVLKRAGEAVGFEVVQHKESMGAFVDSVSGVENDHDNHWWSYYLNGEYGTVSADRAGVEDGDEVRWVYMGSPFG